MGKGKENYLNSLKQLGHLPKLKKGYEFKVDYDGYVKIVGRTAQDEVDADENVYYGIESAFSKTIDKYQIDLIKKRVELDKYGKVIFEKGRYGKTFKMDNRRRIEK